jgi:hypothetical protein
MYLMGDDIDTTAAELRDPNPTGTGVAASRHRLRRASGVTAPPAPDKLGSETRHELPHERYSRTASVGKRLRNSRGKNRDRMALGFYFTPSGFTQDKYDEALSKLEAAGAGAPEGRSYHIALETNGEIQVFDIWESQEAFEAFGSTLVPIMTELGADPGEPMVARVHNVIKG